MNGSLVTRPCPTCGQPLDYVQFPDGHDTFITEDGLVLHACPECETELDA